MLDERSMAARVRGSSGTRAQGRDEGTVARVRGFVDAWTRGLLKRGEVEVDLAPVLRPRGARRWSM